MAGKASSDGAGLDDLFLRLRHMAQGRDTVDVAQFHFIGLDEIRQTYGERWPENRSRILGIADNFLRRRVHASDLLIRGEEGFLVVFGASASVESKAAAHNLAHGLNDFFLGEVNEEPTPRVGVTSQSLSVKELATSLQGMDLVEPEPESEMASAPVENVRVGDFGWQFQPVWDVRREALTNWYAIPYSRKTGARLAGYQFEAASPHPSQFADVDEAGIAVADQALHRLIAQGKQAAIGTSIHIASLSNLSSRARLVAAIDRLDPSIARYRVLKIAGIAPGFPRMYLSEIVATLRLRIPNVVLGLAWDEPDVAGAITTGPVAVGMALPQWISGPGARVQMPLLQTRITDAVTATHAAHLRFFVEGSIVPDLAAKLRTLGVDNISSPGIWTPCAEPDAMLKWPAQRLAAA